MEKELDREASVKMCSPRFPPRLRVSASSTRFALRVGLSMATTDKLRLTDPAADVEQARAMAARYRCEFVDLREASIDHDLFRSIPVDLMFRYNFVPMQARNGTLDIALSDPRNLNLIDELTLLLNRKLRIKVATLSQIAELLKKTEQSQRVLEEVTEGFTLDVVAEDGDQDETCRSTS